MHRSLGFKLGGILFVIGFLFLTQTGLKGLLPTLSLDTYFPNLSIPSELFGINLVIIMWIVMIVGIIFFFIAVFDLPPFNY